MEQKNSRYKAILATLMLACVAVWVSVALLPDKNLHVYFCDVGQGDGILITHLDAQILVDAGPDNKILDCLADHIPFYDKRIELVIITHPQQDHMGGLSDVLDRYNILQLVSVSAEAKIKSYSALIEAWEKGKIEVGNVFTFDEIRLGQLHFKTIWPNRDFVATHTEGKQVLGATTDGIDLNQLAVVGILSFGEFDILLTGDADVPVLQAQIDTGLLRDVEVLKVPHHGSKNGMTEEWLKVVMPEISVISVGGTNRYGHPAPDAIQLLHKVGSKVMRTDLNGTIEIISDGKLWWVNDRF